MRRLGLLFAVLLFALPVLGQERGGGALRMDVNSFSYLRHLFPQLLAVDETGRVIPATDATGELVEDWSVEFGEFVAPDGVVRGRTLVTYTLRDDLTWADGAPITAFDAFPSSIRATWGFADGGRDTYYDGVGRLLNNLTEAIYAPYSEHEIQMLVPAETCAALEARPNFPITSVHRTSPDALQEIAGELDPDQSVYHRHEQALRFLNPSVSYRPRMAFDVIAPGFRLVEVGDDYSRLLVGDLAITTRFSDYADRSEEVKAFISGDLDVIINPSYTLRADLRSVPGVQIVEQVGRAWYALGFNFADPQNPRSAFDAATGEPLDQGAHPLFSDLRVRQAIRLALNPDALGAAATAGHYTRLASDQLPWSWAYNPDLAIPKSDPFEARLLLDSLGWRDWDGDGIRECHDCATAEEDAVMEFSLLYSSYDSVAAITARGIAEQLRRVGVQVSLRETSGSVEYDANAQDFGAYLLAVAEQQPVAADRARLYRQSEDTVYGEGVNFISYVNPELEAVFDRAAHAPDCDYDLRAEALREASAILYDDIPYLPLFAVNDFYAAQGWVSGFAPRQNDPFWNIDSWVVNR
ncbi:MAG: ABC transporter substrate-binding protein [Anaerolineae bacterium]|nr:ABC transporter substrate-binding protein [Anaerolineae bacterium]NUQ02838.1 hypothetical protein [Anaerolineae bacterium]